jgi:catechol 2,3-dioxygenase-like lactoylglutathione lyase family enzyme
MDACAQPSGVTGSGSDRHLSRRGGSRFRVASVAVIRYLVDDVDRAVAFYTDHLGFSLDRRMGPAFAIVSLGDLALWLSGPQSSAARSMPDGRQPEPGGWNRLVIEVDDLEAKVSELRQAGLQFRNEIVTGPGGKQILLEDTAGNPVELFEPRA